jgi:hypothetical protein
MNNIHKLSYNIKSETKLLAYLKSCIKKFTVNIQQM